MANKKYLAISYFFIFLAVYFLFIAYSSLFIVIKDNFNKEIPTTNIINETSSTLSDLSSWGGIGLLILITSVALAIIFSSFGGSAMSSAV